MHLNQFNQVALFLVFLITMEKIEKKHEVTPHLLSVLHTHTKFHEDLPNNKYTATVPCPSSYHTSISAMVLDLLQGFSI